MIEKPGFCTIGQLAKMYGVDSRTFLRYVKRHAKKIGERDGRLYTPSQVRIIFDCLGEP